MKGNARRGLNIKLRRRYVRALQSRPRALTSIEVGHLVGVSPAAALQMLYALERDKIVRRAGVSGSSILWQHTGLEVLGKPAATACVHSWDVSRFDHRALATALGIPVTPIAPPAAAYQVGESL